MSPSSFTALWARSLKDTLTTSEYEAFRRACPVQSPLERARVSDLARFFSVISSITASSQIYWFRGHSKPEWALVPSALRFSTEGARRKALGSLSEFQRIAETKIARPPLNAEKLKWMQLAQHYGLPTRLLDWTRSATTGLFFAALPPDDTDGAVFIMRPADLNSLGPAGVDRVLTDEQDGSVIQKYLGLSGHSAGKRGRPPLAIDPIWNSDRLILQRGGFTLHGSRFDLGQEHAPSLVGIPVLANYKPILREQLSRMGIDRLGLFPELEHACQHLREQIGD